MSVSLFLLALYRGWMGKSLTTSSVSLFSTSSLFDVNVLRVIHSFARPLRLVKVRPAPPEIAYADDQVMICYSTNRLLVTIFDTLSGGVIHQWPGTTRCHIKGALFHTAKQQVLLSIWDLNLRTYAIEFRSLEGQLLRRANIKARRPFSVAVDPVHHYIAIDECRKLRIYTWDNLTEPRHTYELPFGNSYIVRANWDSANHQLMICIDCRSKNSLRIVYFSMTTLQIVDQHDVKGRLQFHPTRQCFSLHSHPSRQCFSLHQNGKMTFWSRRDRLETVVCDTDTSGGLLKFYPGGQYGLIWHQNSNVICRLE